MPQPIERRQFLSVGAVAVAATTGKRPSVIPAKLDTSTILNYQSGMEYRRLGKTGLMVSAVCLGGHWKRLQTMIPGFKGSGYSKEDWDNVNDTVFLRKRSEVVTRCIERGINYVDACSPTEILAYSKVLAGRRRSMYFGFSWHIREPRYPEWRSAAKLIEGLDLSLKEARLDDIDLWRISLPMEAIADLDVVNGIEEATVGALEKAKQQGKTRFTGVSSHNRTWLKYLVERYPKQIEVVLFPYTAGSREVPEDSLFDAVRAQDTGVFGIKPFADNSLFAGDSAPNSRTAGEDNRRARLALRYILENPAITAPIPGLISPAQVDNAVLAIAERQREGKLNRRQRTELDLAARQMWARLGPGYEWLRKWRAV